MTSAMRHRGPDGEGFYFDREVALGVRRLAINDIGEGGRQPMRSEDGSVCLIFNGEIYNFKELRESLLSRGHRFQGKCDGEVVLHLYEDRGLESVIHLRGMFGFVLWDRTRRRLVVARDRLGVKPVYYAWASGLLLVASELKALLASGLMAAEVSRNAVYHYFSQGAIPAPLTIWEGVFSLPPGHLLVLENGQPELTPYWQLPESQGARVKDASEAAEELLRLLREAVRLHLVTDVPLGLFLSGGVDSTVLAALATQGSPGKLSTFTMGYDVGGAEYSELNAARATATHLGTDHHEEILTCEKVVATLKDAIWAMEQPSHDGLNSYFISLAARKSATVLLSGLGGDELFGGYSTFKFEHLYNKFAPVAKPLLAPASGAVRLLERYFPKNVTQRWFWRVLAALGAPGGTPEERYASIRFHFQDEEKGSVLSREFMEARTESRTSLDLVRHLWCSSKSDDALSRLTSLEIKWYMQDVLLRDVDVMSMAHSVEIRVPYLDHVVAEFAARLPTSMRVRGVQATKWLLRRATADLIPATKQRPKRGFRLPMEIWLRDRYLREVVEDCVNPEAVRKRGIVNPAEAAAVHSAFYRTEPGRAGDRAWLRLWLMVVLELWYRQYVDQTTQCAVGRPVFQQIRPCPPSQRLVLLARVFPPRVGGIENYSYEIFRRLALRHEVTVVTPRHPEDRSFDETAAFRIHRTLRLPYLGDRWHTPLGGMLLRSLRNVIVHRPDQIHCDQLDSAIVGYVVRKLFNIPYVVYTYGMEITDGKHTGFKRLILKNAAAVVSISNYTRERLIRIMQVDPGKIMLVPPGVDTDRFLSPRDASKVGQRHQLAGKRVIITVGRLAGTERYKGHDVVIKALSHVSTRVPEVRYLIVGDGPDRERLERLASEVGQSERVVFVGNVSNEDLPAYYGIAEVFVMVSHEVESRAGGVLAEGFGLVFLEAAAAGLPAVGTTSGGIPDAVVDGVTGLLVKPLDSAETADALVRLLSDKELGGRMGHAGRSRVKNRYTWESAASGIEGLVARLADLQGTDVSKHEAPF